MALPVAASIVTARPAVIAPSAVREIPVAPPGPAGPVGPVGPAEPVGPAGPCEPAGPVGPAGPVEPVEPAGPVGPVGPAGPCAPAGPVAPAGPAGPVAPAGPAVAFAVLSATSSFVAESATPAFSAVLLVVIVPSSCTKYSPSIVIPDCWSLVPPGSVTVRVCPSETVDPAIPTHSAKLEPKLKLKLP